ncbi:ribosome hibernation-promoting factor, HPF/YfiA family [Pararhodonellum marinum]|uniref:ribosome hibernation-promoting factor, HPF/YfiA family n=1 Tax=Pararhodonellum marinum TaxID=2755358 RepID=UPI00188E703A|nr:ribosome-associated translation inhibitor RaiA [Pararhodonellum marinum]
MKLQMHSIHFDADQKLIDFIQRKADKLDTYYDRVIDGEVFMRLDKHEKNDNKIVEIKLNLPGRQIFAKNQNGSFEAAADESIEGLRRQIKKFKEKVVLVK